MSESFKITGELMEVGETQEFPSGFSKREFRIEVEDGGYRNDIVFDLFKDKTSVIDSFAVGDTITVSFNVSSREWKKDDGTSKWFTGVNAWRIEGVQSGGGEQITPEEFSHPANKPDPDDGLPF